MGVTIDLIRIISSDAQGNLASLRLRVCVAKFVAFKDTQASNKEEGQTRHLDNR